MWERTHSQTSSRPSGNPPAALYSPKNNMRDISLIKDISTKVDLWSQDIRRPSHPHTWSFLYFGEYQFCYDTKKTYSSVCFNPSWCKFRLFRYLANCLNIIENIVTWFSFPERVFWSNMIDLRIKSEIKSGYHWFEIVKWFKRAQKCIF